MSNARTACNDLPWWQGAVIYQVYPRSFRDSNGDGIGDIAGITEKMEHIADLGCDGLWVSPFFTSPMADFGYDVADYRGVDPIFGTIEDFDAMVARAHALGLKVIIDQVYSHTSIEHAWFEESRQSRDNPKADWYVWADPKPDGSPPNNWQSVFGGASWTWDARRGQYYLHNFLKDQPDLNVHNAQVQDALLEVARFWLDRGVDGFRLDALNFAMHDRALTDNPPVESPKQKTRSFDFQHHFHNQSQPEILGFIERIAGVMKDYGARFTLAEVGGEQAAREMKEFTHGDHRLNSAYGFDYLYADALTPDIVRTAIRSWSGEEGEGWPSWAFSNHDAPRFASRWWDEADRPQAVRTALTLLMCLKGNAILYQGEELGLPQAEVPFEHLQDPEAIANWPLTLGRDGARTPMVWNDSDCAGFGSTQSWLPIAAPHRAHHVAAQEANEGSILNWTKKVISLRNANDALRCGEIEIVDEGGDLLAFERSKDHQRIRCYFNLTAEVVALPDVAGTVLLATGEVAADQNELPPYSALIVETQ
ncbi:alpha-amylase family glycosyl hydrolase [Sphingomicrobium aestuariivivum]|uniref:alpha-amylase family glycosyl hydrolase n=1 Tax=Sphingomicrobium aestuariivivum TaxID=1582356 RepID=UPI001FD6E39F|nr:alpha-amylase family glycosyl hydrolase [Sphingomicrobium aestuariivivum]MCJ8191597.1 alpha-amylase family glycosyl hydrolase [Sphingomicrobium aestuariivivum]